MEEVERLCKRIAIIDTGNIIAQGSRNELVSQLPYTTSIGYEVDRIDDALRQELTRFGELEEHGNTGTLNPNNDLKLSEFFSLLESRNVPYHRFQVKQPSLEALFLHLTGKQLRE